MSMPIDTKALHNFTAKLGYDFADKSWLERAVRHASLDVDNDNEHLEFLGDRVLGLVIAEDLLSRYSGESEGDLARRLGQLVSRKTCAQIAKTIDLGAIIQADKAAMSNTGMTDNILANACEAVLAAVYFDGGLEAARQVIMTHWAPHYDKQVEAPIDHKSALQEWTMKRGQPLPDYEIIDQQGPAHAPEFTVIVRTQEAQAVAKGKSRRMAEQLAAADCLKQMTSKGQN